MQKQSVSPQGHIRPREVARSHSGRRWTILQEAAGFRWFLLSSVGLNWTCPGSLKKSLCGNSIYQDG